ncbi:2OG-Fe(II)oxygenase superfamily protein [Botrytis cinerea]
MPSSTKKSSFYLPLVNITPYLQDPSSIAGQQVLDDVRRACTSTGFFQLVGHGVPATLQKNLYNAAAKFFALPMGVKLPLDVRKNIGFRGYDVMSSQSYEKDVLPDLKEGYIMGTDIPLDDPRVMKRRFFMGERSCMPTPSLALSPTPKQVGNERRQFGSSAHTDFGFITLLLQDENPGLEVQDRETGEWIGVPPNEEAYVVNMGDMISRVTGNLVVFFVDGNLDYKLRRLDKIGQPGEDEEALTVEEHMEERRRTTYGLRKK